MKKAITILLIIITTLANSQNRYWPKWFKSYGDSVYIDTVRQKVFYTDYSVPHSYVFRMKTDPMLMLYDFVKIRRVRRRRKKYETYNTN